MDFRSPWPGAGDSRSGISAPSRRRKGLPTQTASASVRGLMNSTAAKIESRPVIDAVRGEFFCVGEGRRVDFRSPWPGAGDSRSGISAPSRRRKGLPNQTASASALGLMNSTATRMECRPVFDAVRGEFSCVGEGRRVDSRSPWPGAGGSRSGISPPSRRRKGLPNETASANVRGLMNSTAAKIESRPVFDAVRGEFSCVGEGRRVDSRSSWPGAGDSCSRISAPRRRGKGLPNQTASASLGDLAWVPFVHGVSTEVLTVRLPRKVHGRDRSLEIFRFPEAPNGTQAELSSVGIADFFRHLNSYDQTRKKLGKLHKALKDLEGIGDGNLTDKQRSNIRERARDTAIFANRHKLMHEELQRRGSLISTPAPRSIAKYVPFAGGFVIIGWLVEADELALRFHGYLNDLKNREDTGELALFAGTLNSLQIGLGTTILGILPWP